jgi:hypothetical protein
LIARRGIKLQKYEHIIDRGLGYGGEVVAIES